MNTAPEEGVYWDPITGKHVIVLIWDAYELDARAFELGGDVEQLRAWAQEAQDLDKNTVWVPVR
jgi:hypothetical protein